MAGFSMPSKKHSGNSWRSIEESELGGGPREEHSLVRED